MKKRAVKSQGQYFYVGDQDERTLVPESEVEDVREMLRYQQIDYYMDHCSEPSCAIVEERIYDISKGLKLAA